jgi:hypothetical protein
VTETPTEPETPPEDPGTPPTPTEEEEAKTAQQVEFESTEFAYSDHILYSNQLYSQPSWVIEAAFASGTLDPNQKYTKAQVEQSLNTMMQTPDSQFETAEEVQ